MSLQSNIQTEDMMIKTTAEFGYFKYLPGLIRNNARYTWELNLIFPWQKLHSKIRNTFQQQNGLNFLEETSKLLHLQSVIFMVLKLAHFRKQIKNKWKALKCAAARGRRSSVCSIEWEMKKYCI